MTREEIQAVIDKGGCLAWIEENYVTLIFKPTSFKENEHVNGINIFYFHDEIDTLDGKNGLEDWWICQGEHWHEATPEEIAKYVKEEKK